MCAMAFVALVQGQGLADQRRMSEGRLESYPVGEGVAERELAFLSWHRAGPLLLTALACGPFPAWQSSAAQTSVYLSVSSADDNQE